MAIKVKNGAIKINLSGISRFPYLYLVFSIVFAIFVLGPPFLGFQFGPYPLMHVADVLDIFTALVILPLYWLMFRSRGDTTSLRQNLVFVVFAAFWALGKGMHLAANSIDNLITLKGLQSGDIYNLVYFYDETLGHYLWHFGVIGLSALLIYRESHDSLSMATAKTKSNIAAGIIYGFVFFAMVVEGTTVDMGLPFSVLALILIAVWNRTKLSQRPLTILFLIGYSLALVLFIIWGVWHQGFPGFFEAGIL